MTYMRQCSCCDDLVISTKKENWPLCEKHKDSPCPICPKCKKHLKFCDYLAMGITMKCDPCNINWHKTRGFLTK